MSTPESLAILESAITACAASVVELKTSKSPVEQIKAAVVALVASKQAYADANGGKLSDGSDFPAKSDKDKSKDKKKDAKESKGGAEGGGGDNVMNEANQKKKEAKKLEAKMKKLAVKNGDEPPPPAPVPKQAGEKKSPQISAAKPANTNTTATSSKNKPQAQQAKPLPFELSFSPNAQCPLPSITLLSTELLNLSTDLTLKMDITRVNAPVLGSLGKSGTVSEFGIFGDLAITRYFVGQHSRVDLTSLFLGGDEWSVKSKIDMWMFTCLEIRGALASSSNGDTSALRGLLESVESTFAQSSGSATICGTPDFTLADVIVFDTLTTPPDFKNQSLTATPLLQLDAATFPATAKWYATIASSTAFRVSRRLIFGVDGTSEVVDPNNTVLLDDLVPGCHPLEGAEPGDVVTRFPPEPSGYLHIGHAKAVLLNNYYANRYKGKLIVRFDDTNPSKEKEEFEQAISEDLISLGVKPNVFTYTSDYFAEIKEYAILLIREGKAYMDDTPQETMQSERMARTHSKHRDQSVEDALMFFDELCTGSAEGSKWCLRGKVNMASNNGTMRDPVFYRSNLTPHHRSGTTYKAYPTYDLACPIVDSVEGVTHALRTTEYNDRDEQYAWVQNNLRLRRTRIHSFARMNFMFTELSKRKLTWFVENNIVSGWDDPRFPTVRGVVRRGINMTALNRFILSQGASRRITLMEWNKFWAENKKDIDPTAARYFIINHTSNATLTITNAPVGDHFVSADLHPKNPGMGKRLIRIGKDVKLEIADVAGLAVGEEIALMRWSSIKITKVIGGENFEGEIVDTDIRECKKKFSWICNASDSIAVKMYEFDNLLSKEKLEEGEDFKDFINPNNLASMTGLGSSDLKLLCEHDVVQVERRGFYRVDKAWRGLGEEEGLVLFMVPDGKAKAMSNITGSLTHR